MELKGDTKCTSVKYLFHGTSKTDPEKIYNQNVGFDLRYANAGSWGNAIYFAKKA